VEADEVGSRRYSTRQPDSPMSDSLGWLPTIEPGAVVANPPPMATFPAGQ